MKALSLQFFVLLNALMARLIEACRYHEHNEDPMDFPVTEMARDVIWNIVLVACTWSFGAVLNKDLRKMMDE